MNIKKSASDFYPDFDKKPSFKFSLSMNSKRYKELTREEKVAAFDWLKEQQNIVGRWMEELNKDIG